MFKAASGIWLNAATEFLSLLEQVASDMLYGNILAIIAPFVALGMLCFVLRLIRQRG